MKPLEIVDHKSDWIYDAAHTVFVNVDAWHRCFDFCSNNFDKQSWGARKHMRQDDAHWFLFEHKADHDLFVSNFDTLEEWNQTNTFEKMTAKKDQTL